MADDKPLTDAEYDQMVQDKKTLQQAHAKDPVATRAALMDAVKSLQKERGIAPVKGKLPNKK
jgi:hypothetical protein